MGEDHLDPDIHLWPETCPECEDMQEQIEKLEAKLERLTGLIEKHNADCDCPCKSSTSETAHFDYHAYDGDCPEDYKIALEGEQDG